MKIFKRAISFILITCMVTLSLSSCSKSINVDDIEKEQIVGSEANEQYKYNLYPKYAVITQYLGNDEVVNIPKKLGGKHVVALDDYSFSCLNSSTTIIIPDTVILIGQYTFWNCSSLVNVKIPASVKVIKDYAFRTCSVLETVSIESEGLISIGASAFEYCSALSNIILPQGIKTIGAQAFFGCSGMKALNLPSSVNEIGKNAFLNCPDLILKVVKSSYAGQYANENGVAFIAA